MSRPPRLLTWHPGLERWTGRFDNNRQVMSVSHATVMANYHALFTWWLQRDWIPPLRADAEARTGALSVTTYENAARCPHRRRPEQATWDVQILAPDAVPSLDAPAPAPHVEPPPVLG